MITTNLRLEMSLKVLAKNIGSYAMYADIVLTLRWLMLQAGNGALIAQIKNFVVINAIGALENPLRPTIKSHVGIIMMIMNLRLEMSLKVLVKNIGSYAIMKNADTVLTYHLTRLLQAVDGAHFAQIRSSAKMMKTVKYVLENPLHRILELLGGIIKRIKYPPHKSLKVLTRNIGLFVKKDIVLISHWVMSLQADNGVDIMFLKPSKSSTRHYLNTMT